MVPYFYVITEVFISLSIKRGQYVINGDNTSVTFPLLMIIIHNSVGIGSKRPPRYCVLLVYKRLRRSSRV